MADYPGRFKDWKLASINRYQAAFSLISNIAIDHDPPKMPRNPASGIQRNREKERKSPVDYGRRYQRLVAEMAKAGPKFVASVDPAMNTGMRDGKQYRLQWNQIDLERWDIFLGKTKNGDPRHIPLNDAALAALRVLAGDQLSDHLRVPVFRLVTTWRTRRIESLRKDRVAGSSELLSDQG